MALVIFGPLLLLAFVAWTRFSWLPGVLVIVGAMVMFSMIDTDLHGDVGGISAFANGVLTLEAIGLFVYGVILLVVGALLYRKRERNQPSPRSQSSPLPVATVVAGVDND